ncbi:hypothetical protein P0Y35_05900 [Kiritimatiellaeota bacterium B1221]|nr:hypothetical protein [Kiritimatiellaeota bacterium B1221]
MKELEKFLKEYTPDPIVPPAELERIQNDVKAVVKDCVRRMAQAADPVERGKMKVTQKRRINALSKALNALTEDDKELLEIGGRLSELNIMTIGPRSIIPEELGDKIRNDIENLKSATFWALKDEPTQRYDASLRKHFVFDASYLYAAYGFTDIGENFSEMNPKQRSPFQLFLHAILRDCGIPEPCQTTDEHLPFDRNEYPVSCLGDTPEKRAVWMENHRSFLTA